MKNMFYVLLLFLFAACANQKPAPIPAMGTQAWMEQVDRVAGIRDNAHPGPTIGSDEWMIAVSRQLGVYDDQGHGPDLRSEEWKRAIHRKAFGNEPATTFRVTYVSGTGERLNVIYDNLRQNVTVTRAARIVTLPIARSASGARYTADGKEVFWNKGAKATYWQDGKIVFEGAEETDCFGRLAVDALARPPDHIDRCLDKIENNLK